MVCLPYCSRVISTLTVTIGLIPVPHLSYDRTTYPRTSKSGCLESVREASRRGEWNDCRDDVIMVCWAWTRIEVYLSRGATGRSVGGGSRLDSSPKRFPTALTRVNALSMPSLDDVRQGLQRDADRCEVCWDGCLLRPSMGDNSCGTEDKAVVVASDGIR